VCEDATHKLLEDESVSNDKEDADEVRDHDSDSSSDDDDDDDEDDDDDDDDGWPKVVRFSFIYLSITILYIITQTFVRCALSTF